MSGFFIAFEGGEGSGKSTQARLLADRLAQEGRKVTLTREPGGTPGAEAIRQLLLSPPGEGWQVESEAALFAAARADHVARLIRPALDRGECVVADRFLDSSRAYQGGAGGLGDAAILALHEICSGGLRPDLTLLIAVDAGEVARRLAERDGGESDAIGGRSAAYHAKVADAFHSLAEAEPERYAVIDGNGAQEDVAARVWDALRALPGAAT